MWRNSPVPIRLPCRFFWLPLSRASHLDSFLEPNIFSFAKEAPLPSSPSKSSKPASTQLTQDQLSLLENTLHRSLITKDTDLAWKSFKSLVNTPSFGHSNSKNLLNSLISNLSGTGNTSLINLKRAFACCIYLIEKDPGVLNFEAVRSLLVSINDANLTAPAFTLVKCMLRNRYFMPFALWGDILLKISQRNGKYASFFRVFEECCKVSIEEKMEFMSPDLNACNAALSACCYELESISDSEIVLENMSVLGIRPNEMTVGLLACLYASKGTKQKVDELKNLLHAFGFPSRRYFYSSLISGYVKAGNLASVSEIIMCGLMDQDVENPNFSQQTYSEVVQRFLKDGCIKELANLIIKAQELEPKDLEFNNTVGFGIINACVSLGMSVKANSIVDELDAQGVSVGIGVYIPILNAYCKEYQTSEATQLVMKISNAGLSLDLTSYDALIEASMANQDFHSAFTLFRDMRESRVEDLKGSYLTIMTGLMEKQRPELMAAFLDEIIGDPRVEVKTHDWNSIIHAFFKAGRLEDAKRTYRRMVFLQFEPNIQTCLSLINGYVTAEKYFNVLLLWNEIRNKTALEKDVGLTFDSNLIDAFLYALVKGGFFDAAMQVVTKSQEMKIFVDKWRYKQAFMETHKKLKVSKLRRRSVRKMEALVAFKNWVGLST